jgi:hypothetical protein
MVDFAVLNCPEKFKNIVKEGEWYKAQKKTKKKENVRRDILYRTTEKLRGKDQLK